MTDTVAQPAPLSPRDDEPPTRSGRRTVGRVLAVLAASTCLVWIGAIVYGAVADPHPTGWLDDRTFPTAAEKICKRAMDDLEGFPPAHTSKSPAQRVVVIRATTARLQKMLAELRATVPDTADARWIGRWLDDWEIHIKDRLDFANRLERRGASQEFLETEKAGTQISNSLDHYAEINDMADCDTPGDV